MKIELVNIIQKCVCIDILLNSFINSNASEYFTFLNSIKYDNTRNLNILYRLYESTYKEELSLNDLHAFTTNEIYDDNDNITTLLQLNLNVITELEILKKLHFNNTYFKLIQNLINSYFNFVSLINNFCPLPSRCNTLIDSNSTNLHFFNMIGSSFDSNEMSLDLIRKISLSAIEYFFDYTLSDNGILDEFYEIFFPNSPENKFYQFFFKSHDYHFKIRISHKNGLIFYIYKSFNNNIDIANTSLSKEDAIEIADDYLKNKFPYSLDILVLDKNYINISYYMNEIDTYKLRYNFYNTSTTNNNLHLTINVKLLEVQEITLF